MQRFLVFGLLFLLSACVSQKKYFEALNEKEDFKVKAETLQGTLTDANDRISQLNKENGTLEERIRVVGTTVAELEGENESLKSEIKQANTELLNQKQQLALAIRDTEEQIQKRDLQLQRTQREADLKIQLLQEVGAKLEPIAFAFPEQIELFNTDQAVVMIVNNSLLFGDLLTLSSIANQVLEPYATIAKENRLVETTIIGHTSNAKVRQRNVQDNWDLSALRAAAVVRTLVKQYQVDAKRLTVAGKGAIQPIANNELEAGRIKNERMEFRITPNLEALYRQLEK